MAGPSRSLEDVRRPAPPGERAPSMESPVPPGKAKPRDEIPPTRFDAVSKTHQTPAQQSNRGEIDLVIGLDFGTAATKVVIRSPFMRQRARAISFGEFGHSSSQYLLPTRLRLGRDGHLSLRADVGGEWATDLKIRLLDRVPATTSASDMGDPIKGATAYLALV